MVWTGLLPMPDVYLDLNSSGGLIKDKESQSFPDLDAALKHARQFIRELVASDILEGREVDLNHSIAIHEGSKEPAASVNFAEVVRFLG